MKKYLVTLTPDDTSMSRARKAPVTAELVSKMSVPLGTSIRTVS